MVYVQSELISTCPLKTILMWLQGMYEVDGNTLPADKLEHILPYSENAEYN